MWLGQVDMDIVVFNIFLSFVCGIDVGLCVFYKVIPSDTTDIRGFPVPVSQTAFANVLFCGFEVEHVLPNDGKCRSDKGSVGEKYCN